MFDFDEKKKAKINAYFRQKDQAQKEMFLKTHAKKFEELRQFTVGLNEENYKQLKQLAISENGFLTMEIRRKIYDKLLLLGEGSVEGEKYDFLFLDQNKSNVSRKHLVFNKLSIGEKEIGINSK